MRFVILGAGAMGCLYGAKLKKASQDIALIGVRQSNIDAINQKGLLVRFAEGEERIIIKAFTAEEFPCSGKAEAVILFTKGSDSETALHSIREVIGPETLLISFQNGVGHEKIMEQYTDRDHIVIGTTNFPSERPENGQIISTGEGVTRMMTASGNKTESFMELVEIFERADLHPEVVPDIYTAIWEKVAFNAALNSLTAITRLPQGYLGQTEEGRMLAHRVVSEVCMVARKKEIAVDEGKVHVMVDTLLTEHFEHQPSMLQDVCNGRRTEIDCINGAVVREAEKMGMDVPVTKVLYELIRIIEQTYSHQIERT